MLDSEPNSDISLPSQLSSHTSESSMFMSFSESSYNSDHGSGNDNGRDSNFVIYSSDEVEYFALWYLAPNTPRIQSWGYQMD